MSSRTGAAIVLSNPMSRTDAQSACEALSESLWSLDASDGDFLKYLVYENMDGPYWIAGQDSNNCKSFDPSGLICSQSCDDFLPALCTQSAPLSNLSYADNSTTWRTTVTSGQQSWNGFRDKFSFRFEGVRYAAQPERFTYSSVFNKPGHYEALNFGSECVQAGDVGSEDCLFLNIWTPYLPSTETVPAEKLKPVMFWIHGGAFTSGTGSDPTFDGGSLVSRGDVVVVTINYRLGTLGFLALNDGVTNGNFGLADQITALDWVHEHIRAFGGDPNRITIFGQSAGAASVRALLASREAAGKFAAAIPQSNLAGSNYATTYSDYYTIHEEVSMFAKPILNITNCTTAPSHLHCLRTINPYFLANQSDPEIARYLVVDGTYLTTPQLEVTGLGHVNNASVLMGFMRDDGAAFISYPLPNDTATSFLRSNGFNLSTIGPLSVFPEPSGPNKTLDLFNQTARLATDAEFRCLDEATAYSASIHNIFRDLYFYEFNRSYQLSSYSPNFPVCQAPPTHAYPFGDPNKEYFKCHSGELYYVFGSLLFNGLPPRDDFDIPMSQFTLDTWSSFARTHNPTPDLRFLQARGFTNTTTEILRSLPWEQVGDGRRRLRLMQYPSLEEPFGIYDGQVECEDLGFGIGYYERRLSKV